MCRGIDEKVTRYDKEYGHTSHDVKTNNSLTSFDTYARCTSVIRALYVGGGYLPDS